MKALWVFLLFSATARADVLFLDLNNNPMEIEAARSAISRRNRAENLQEQLIVYPPEMPANVRSNLNRLNRERDAATQRPNFCDTRDCQQQANQILSNLYSEIEGISGPYTYNEEKFRELLASQVSAGRTFSSVIASGHDGTGNISGTRGTISDTTLAASLGAFPTLANSIRTLHLWGCYTTAPGSLLTNWKKHFPNIALITGFQGLAPLGHRPAGHEYLRGVLERENEMLASTDAIKLQRLLNGISSVHLLDDPAINRCDQLIQTDSTVNLREMLHSCESKKTEFEERKKVFDCYFRATEEGCENPPSNTSASDLRSFYRYLYDSIGACSVLPGFDEMSRTANTEQTLRLIFFREVTKNFQRLFGSTLAEVDLELEKLGAPPVLRFSGLQDLSRQDLLQRLDMLTTFIEKSLMLTLRTRRSPQNTLRQASLYMLRDFHTTLVDTLMNLRSDCVPFEWIEPNASVTGSCVNTKNLGAQGVRAQKTLALMISTSRPRPPKPSTDASAP